MRTLWIAAVVAEVIHALLLLTFTFGGIWLQSPRMGWTAAALFVLGLPTLPTLCIWTSEDQPYKSRRLSRDLRRRLAEEQERITFDAEVARMEREAGIK